MALMDEFVWVAKLPEKSLIENSDFGFGSRNKADVTPIFSHFNAIFFIHSCLAKSG